MSTQKDYLNQQYDLFLHEYERLHPTPSTDTSSQRRALIIMLVAAVIVSARHNIPFFLGDSIPSDFIGQALTIIIAVAVVAMVEIGLVKMGEFLIAYMDNITVSNLRPALLVFALALLLIVAISSNVIDQLEVKSIYVNEHLKTAINIVAGLTAPIMALITGVIFASLEMKVQDDQAIWQTNFNRAWSTFKRQNEIDLTVSMPRLEPTDNTPRLSVSMSNQTDNRQTGAGFNRASTAVDNAKQWLLNNPDKMDLPLRELANLIPDAGKDSINKARKMIQENVDSDSTN